MKNRSKLKKRKRELRWTELQLHPTVTTQNTQTKPQPIINGPYRNGIKMKV